MQSNRTSCVRYHASTQDTYISTTARTARIKRLSPAVSAINNFQRCYPVTAITGYLRSLMYLRKNSIKPTLLNITKY